LPGCLPVGVRQEEEGQAVDGDCEAAHPTRPGPVKIGIPPVLAASSSSRPVCGGRALGAKPHVD